MILTTLLHDADFLSFLGEQLHPKLSRMFPKYLSRKVRQRLKTQFDTIHDVDAWQKTIAPYVERLIHHTTSHLTVSGIEHLDKDKSYLFISNHRDIAMDPMLINYALLSSGFCTSKVAIGDNLLGRPFVAKLMRLNKSFVVKRSLTARREKLDASQKLSDYVHESKKQNHSIWIAQKEGRAKDNKDKTDSAVLKMLHLSGRKLGWGFNESMNFLNIVPVSISYEWDPCDIDKATELTTAGSDQGYKKSKDEDFHTIIKGLKGYKGKVRVHFSSPITMESDQAEDWVNKIDECIFDGYELYDNNRLAYEMLMNKTPEDSQFSKQELAGWKKRFSKTNKDIYSQIVSNYAQPVFSKFKKNTGI